MALTGKQEVFGTECREYIIFLWPYGLPVLNTLIYL